MPNEDLLYKNDCSHLSASILSESFPTLSASRLRMIAMVRSFVKFDLVFRKKTLTKVLLGIRAFFPSASQYNIIDACRIAVGARMQSIIEMACTMI